MVEDSSLRATAIFGGSFNPIHCGHIALAKQVLAQRLAQEVWFIVSPQNPLKKRADLLDESLRLSLVREALAEERGLVASDYEFRLPRPSYTWQTLRALRRDFPHRRFSLLIGADNWAMFPKWARYEELLRDYPIVLYPRAGVVIDRAALPPSVTMLNAPLFPYSSTSIRHAVRNKIGLDGMVPAVIQNRVQALYSMNDE